MRGALRNAVIAAFLVSCGSDGGVTIASDIFAPLGEPLPGATAEQKEAFVRGREVALRRFDEEQGLGPHFNVTFCGSCHEKPVLGGAAARYRNFLLVRRELSGGGQVSLGVNGVQPQYRVQAPHRMATDEGANLFALRNPIPFFGIGLLAEIPPSEILARADEDDADKDGVSGRPNFEGGFVARFGRKAQTASIEGFIRGPLFNHMGITSDPLPPERERALPVPRPTVAPASFARRFQRLWVGVAHAQVAAGDGPTRDNDGAADPELGEQDLFDLISFAMLLAVPAPSAPTGDAELGRGLFERARCTACHVPVLRGPRGGIPAYTDLLLHDMGDALADGIRMGVATGSEFRTQPLWGVAASAPYLHDGRADTLDEAIRMHGGEATASRDAYLGLTGNEQSALLAFLDSLGASAQKTEGLLAPETPVPEPGAFGGPSSALAAADAERFVRGRAAFDRDLKIRQGLGTRFNGDSCRACHFDPVLGGSGPAGVDVIRHGSFDFATGEFTAPAMGTMAHHHHVGPERPPVDSGANVYEARQTPALFGLGLVDQIPDAALLALADPNDDDGDGIRGRVHRLPDGRIGRFGWKANVPSLSEFARDALSAEVGLTVPEEAGHSFGVGSDSDPIADPEFSQADIDAIVFFMQQLGPPPRVSEPLPGAEEGEAIFSAVGCADCHVPELSTASGDPVRLYSDLLLHDIAGTGVAGIAEGAAGPHDFRTAPLWGLSKTAPYMHDGRAFSIERAIARHYGEAGPARQRVEALSMQDRNALMAFLRSL